MAGAGGGTGGNRVLTGVLAVLENQYRQVAFVQPGPGPGSGHWLLPGGALEPGEPAEAAVVRHVLAQTGIAIQGAEFMGVYELRSDQAEAPYHRLVLAFTAHTYQDLPSPSGGEQVGSAAFFDPQKMSTALDPVDMQVLTDAGLVLISRSTIARALATAGIHLGRYGLRPVQPLTVEESAARRLRG